MSKNDGDGDEKVQLLNDDGNIADVEEEAAEEFANRVRAILDGDIDAEVDAEGNLPGGDEDDDERQPLQFDSPEDAERAEAIVQAMWSPGTKKNYNSKIKCLLKYLFAKHPEKVDGTSIILPLTVQVVTEFFGSDDTIKNGVDKTYKAFSTVDGYKSAIVYIYSNAKQKPPEDEAYFMKKYMVGYRNSVPVWKQLGVYSKKATGGRNPFNHRAFIALMSYAYRGVECKTADDQLFAITFTCLLWCTLARSISIAALSYYNMRWENDGMIIKYPSGGKTQLLQIQCTFPEVL